MADEGMEAYFETSSNAEALRRAGAGEDHIVTAQEMKNTSLTESAHSSPHLYSHLPVKPNATSTPLNKQEAIHIRILVEEIMKSALLTEDDCLLLESVMKIEGLRDSTKKKINYLFNNWWYIYVSLLVMVVSVFFSCSVCLLMLVVMVTGGFTLFKVRETRSEARMRAEREGINNYLIKMESLLNLIMKSLNTIRERELVYHGFLRPVKGLSANRIDSQLHNSNSNSFQCHSLRERLHQVCSEGKEMMGSVTGSLINGYPLNVELDNKDTYLLYRELPKDEHVLLLEALKDAASLMAIVNSEMLRRLCLVLGRHLINEQSVLDKTDKRLSISTAFQFLKPIYEHVNDSLTQIQWSLDYQNHKYTIKDGSTDNSSVINASGNKKAECRGAEDKPLSSIEAELHAADLHVHTTLIKLRELSDDSSGEVWEEEIRSILSNITSAEHHLQQVLSELSQPAPPPSPPLATSTPNFVNIEDDNEGTEVLCNTQETTGNDDDEEMIYEAYVSSLDQISQLEEQEIVSNEEWRKTSLNILHELKSVLSVRKAMKEKKRRKKIEIEETPLPKENDQNDSVERSTKTNNSNEAGSSCFPSTPEKSQDSDDGRRIATEVDGSGDQLMQLQLMARAAAASKRREQNEEIFELSDNDENEKD